MIKCQPNLNRGRVTAHCHYWYANRDSVKGQNFIKAPSPPRPESRSAAAARAVLAPVGDSESIWHAGPLVV